MIEIRLGEKGTHSVDRDISYLDNLYRRYYDIKKCEEYKSEAWSLLGIDRIPNFSWNSGRKTLPKIKIRFSENNFGNDEVSIIIEESEGEKDFIGLVKKLLKEKGHKLKL